MRLPAAATLLAFLIVIGTNCLMAGTVPITLFSTGVDSSGVPLPGGSQDPHYFYQTTGSPNAYVLSVGNVWGSWPTSSTGKWINIADSTNTNGTFTFFTTFDLTGMDPSTAEISGWWTSDNASTMYLNGNSVTSLDWGAFNSLHYLSIPAGSGFMQGINTLSVTVGMDSWDGLLISEIRGSANQIIPEPSTTSMLLIGIAALSLTLLRRFQLG